VSALTLVRIHIVLWETNLFTLYDRILHYLQCDPLTYKGYTYLACHIHVVVMLTCFKGIIKMHPSTSLLDTLEYIRQSHVCNSVLVPCRVESVAPLPALSFDTYGMYWKGMKLQCVRTCHVTNSTKMIRSTKTIARRVWLHVLHLRGE
jgi:hypothetical protein